MNTLARASLVLSCALFLLPACKKDQPDTTNPDGNSTDGPTGPITVVQDPDPAEIAQARADFLAGEYARVISSCEAVIGKMTGESQQRAKAKAEAWLMLGHFGENLPENGHAALDAAVAAAGALSDPELNDLVDLASGAYLLATHQSAQALPKLEAVASRGKEAGLAYLLHAQALLGMAFDDEDQLTDPAKIDAAAKSYQFAHDKSDDPLIKARALAGLAGTAFYKKDKAGVCDKAKAAAALYDQARAARTLTDVTAQMIGDSGCK